MLDHVLPSGCQHGSRSQLIALSLVDRHVHASTDTERVASTSSDGLVVYAGAPPSVAEHLLTSGQL